MANKLEELLKELDNQKRKYHEKMLTSDAELTLLMRSFQIYDFMVDISNLLIPEFYVSNLISSLLFDFDLSELEPLNLEFTWRFPDLEEWLRGVSIVFERVIPDYAVSVEEFVRTNIKEEYQEDILGTRIEKGVYGVSKYGQSYYDPPAVREFLKTTTLTLFKKHPPFTTRREAYDKIIEALNLNPDVIRSIHDRISMLISAHTECFILGYGIIGITKLCRESPHNEGYGIVPFINYDGELVEAEIQTLDHILYGCILGVSALGYCFLLPEESIFVTDAKQIVEGIADKLRKLRDRIMLTAPGFSNYVRGDEAVDYHKCERTNIWGELMGIRYVIESLVDNYVSSKIPELDPFTKRKYITAVLQLVGHIGKRHKWGYDVFKAMEDVELRKWWTDFWITQGLDLKILLELYNMVKVWLPQVLKTKLALGKKLRLERLQRP
jgi:hypothetical protein